MTKLILHIGTTKTGTTAIQKFLALNAKQLAAQGVGFPIVEGAKFKDCVTPERNAHYVQRKVFIDLGVIEATDRDRIYIPQFEAAVDEAIQSSGAVVLSDEKLWSSGFRKGFWEALKAYYDARGVTEYQIIVYLRRQDLYIESRWNQLVKQGGLYLTSSLHDFLYSKQEIKRADYAAGLKKIQAAFGDSAEISIGIFEREHMPGGDVVPDFLQKAGIQLDDAFVRPEKEANERLSGNFAEIKRIMNESSVYRGSGNFMRDKLVHATNESTQTAKTAPLEAKERKKYLKQFEEGNAWVARTFFNTSSSLFGTASSDDAPVWKYDEKSVLHDAVLVLTNALTDEREHRQNCEKRIKALEERVAELESHVLRQADPGDAAEGE